MQMVQFLDGLIVQVTTMCEIYRNSARSVSQPSNVKFQRFAMGTAPLCCEQYPRTFSTTRIPQLVQGKFREGITTLSLLQ